MSQPNLQPSGRPIAVRGRHVLFLFFCLTIATSALAAGQNNRQSTQANRPGDQRAAQVLSEQPAVDDGTAATPTTQAASINVLELIWQARWLMIPIIVMSVVVIGVAIERALALRRHQIAPPQLVAELDSLSTTNPWEPSKLIQACSTFPSTLATVVLETLRKLGRPQNEVEAMATNVMQRESERLYRNVRTLNLAAAVTPLMGLLGTVWGMIAAFFATANLPVGANKAESLAEGIYFALVTTAGGLVVAIPAAMLAHWLEGRIRKTFLDMEELLSRALLPQTARLEGRRGGRTSAAVPTQMRPVPVQASNPSAPPAPPVRRPKSK